MTHSAAPDPATAEPSAAADDPPEPADRDSCPLRDWGCAADLRRPTWHLLSHHRTSDTEVEYCACDCGAVVVLHGDHLVAFTGPPAD
ncbi:hypothetical protein ACIF9R_18000 [Streptomyces sp. NPDC086080]|uniref:hypothetical protein n=1 Tax=Streptomyces sp. NPDC086080 TaxID=3365748 RepID=UPI0037D3A5E0